MSVRIAAVVPARNAAATLAETLASVFDQTDPPSEVVVVDDGSTDATAAIARKLGARVVRGPGGGVAGARNLGLAAAEGADYVGLLDADDRWHPDFIAAARELIAGAPIAAFVSARVVDDDERVIGGHTLPDGPVSLAALLRGRVVPTTSATVVHRERVLALDGFHEGFETPAGVEDLDLWFRLADAGSLVATSRVCATYVVHTHRDRDRTEAQLSALERDRERVIARLRERGTPADLLGAAAAIMRARTARYWMITGRSAQARRSARASLRARPTVEGAVTLAAACVPDGVREQARGLRRHVRSRRAE